MSSLNPEPDATTTRQQVIDAITEGIWGRTYEPDSDVRCSYAIDAADAVLALPEIRRALAIAATWDEMNEMGRRPASDAASAKRYYAAKDRLLSLRGWS